MANEEMANTKNTPLSWQKCVEKMGLCVPLNLILKSSTNPKVNCCLPDQVIISALQMSQNPLACILPVCFVLFFPSYLLTSLLIFLVWKINQLPLHTIFICLCVCLFCGVFVGCFGPSLQNLVARKCCSLARKSVILSRVFPLNPISPFLQLCSAGNEESIQIPLCHLFLCETRAVYNNSFFVISNTIVYNSAKMTNYFPYKSTTIHD